MHMFTAIQQLVTILSYDLIVYVWAECTRNSMLFSYNVNYINQRESQTSRIYVILNFISCEIKL